jgi:hypothetical protein
VQAVNAQALPTARHGFEIPDQYTKTTDGRRFLFHDSGVDDCNRILIFTTDDNRCCEARTRTIMQRYPTIEIVDFLRAIANNLAI